MITPEAAPSAAGPRAPFCITPMLTTAGPTFSTTAITACEYASSRLSSLTGSFATAAISLSPPLRGSRPADLGGSSASFACRRIRTLLEHQQLLRITPPLHRVWQLFARDQCEAAPFEQPDDLALRDSERRSARPLIQWERQVDVSGARLQEPCHQVGIVLAPPRVDGAEAGVLQHIVEGAVQRVRQLEHIVLQDLDGRLRVCQAPHLLHRRG